MEKLGLLITKLVNDGKWFLIKVAQNGPAVSYLFFAEDCLLFIKAKTSQIKLLHNTLKLFCEASELKVNLDKSKFYASTNVSQIKGAKFSQISSIP